jgi:hypothetical protein
METVKSNEAVAVPSPGSGDYTILIAVGFQVLGQKILLTLVD